MINRDIVEKLRKENPDFFLRLVIELGRYRIKDKCALCDKKIDYPDYHIQLCTSCRLKYIANEY